jgi:hypothetical protein
MSKLDEVFDIDPHDIQTTSCQTVIPPESDSTEDQDFSVARANYFEIIDATKAAINTAVRVAAESENPRAIEVLSGLLKTAADINKQLIQLNKDKAEVKVTKKQASGQLQSSMQPQIGTVQQAVFVGSSADLNKMLSDKIAK